MDDLFDDINNRHNTEFTNNLVKNKHIFYEIYKECGNQFGCGSYLIDGQSYQYCDIMYEKQELLYKSVKGVKNALEVGTYMGHSALIMLLSNPTLKLTCIDIDQTFAGPAVRVLNKYFNNAITFIHGDSIESMSQMTDRYDFFHIDGSHHSNIISQEFDLCAKLNNNVSELHIIFDDQTCMGALQRDIESRFVVEVKIIPECSRPNWSNLYYKLITQTPSEEQCALPPVHTGVHTLPHVDTSKMRLYSVSGNNIQFKLK